jgi:hypothetical protein
VSGPCVIGAPSRERAVEGTGLWKASHSRIGGAQSQSGHRHGGDHAGEIIFRSLLCRDSQIQPHSRAHRPDVTL